MVITSAGQEYKSTESQQDYKTEMGMTYGGRGVPIDIGKFKDNFDKDGKLRCFNCNIWTHGKELPKTKERKRY